MEKLKDLKIKHCHTLTDILKVLIFAIVMLAPFFAVMTECLYMICNKNAPANYTGVQQDVFYNAVANLSTKALFNWTENTGIYQAIYGLTNGLEMQNTIALLLTYWTITTLVYIIFDIVIVIFTKITHIFNSWSKLETILTI